MSALNGLVLLWEIGAGIGAALVLLCMLCDYVRLRRSRARMRRAVRDLIRESQGGLSS